jgi:hypothetical protein
MKNATQLYERGIREFLSTKGCQSIHIEKGSLVALRVGGDGRVYHVSIDLYEDDTPETTPSRRFRARAARRFGLPVSANHGTSVEAALEALQWRTLDCYKVPPQVPVLAGVI